MHPSFLFLFSFLVMLPGQLGKDQFDLIVEVRPTAGTRLPARLWVSLDHSDTGFHSSTNLARQRIAKFQNLTPGRYRVTVKAEGYQSSQAETLIRPSSGDEYVTVELGPPESREKLPGEKLPGGVVDYRFLQLSSQAQSQWQKAQKALAANQLDSALESLKQVTRLEPNFALGHNTLGAVSLKLRKSNQAEQAFLKATELEPTDYRHQVGLGWFYLASSQVAEALVPLQKAVELQPDDVEANALLGEAMRRAGNSEQSVVHLEKALVLDPTFGIALHSLALAFLDLNKPAQALRTFRALLQTEDLPDAEMEKVKKLVSELEGKLAEKPN